MKEGSIMGVDDEVDEDLRMLGDALLRALVEPAGEGRTHWDVMVHDLGLCGLGIDESLGGLGGGARHVWQVMETQGGTVVSTPFLSAMVLGAGVLKHAGGDAAEALLRRVAAGKLRLAVAYLEPGRRNAVEPRLARTNSDWVLTGRKVSVLDAEGADLLIVSARDAEDEVTLFAVPAGIPGLRMVTGDSLGGGRWSDLSFDQVSLTQDMVIGQPGVGLAALEQALDDAVVAVCAEAVGAMNAMLERTVEYVKQRHQFGRPIGDFQVVQHRLVDMLIAAEQAESLARVARDKLAGPTVDRMEAVSGAKVLISGACRVVAQGAVQLHGGIGTTEELDLSVFFRRALVAESLFGDAAYHLARYEKLSLQKIEHDIISGPTGRPDRGVEL